MPTLATTGLSLWTINCSVHANILARSLSLVYRVLSGIYKDDLVSRTLRVPSATSRTEVHSTSLPRIKPTSQPLLFLPEVFRCTTFSRKTGTTKQANFQTDISSPLQQPLCPPSLFSTRTEEKHVLTTRTSGTLSPRRCEQTSSLDRCVLSFPSFHCQTNQTSQFAFLLRPDNTTYIHSCLLVSSLDNTDAGAAYFLMASCGSSIPLGSPLVVNLHVASPPPSCGRFPLHLRPVAHSASMHPSFVTTCLVYCVLIARYRHSTHLDNQPATPPHTRQQDHSTTHQLTGISSITAPLPHSYSRPR